MPKIDAYEHEVLTAFDKGQLKSVATKAELVFNCISTRY